MLHSSVFYGYFVQAHVCVGETGSNYQLPAHSLYRFPEIDKVYIVTPFLAGYGGLFDTKLFPSIRPKARFMNLGAPPRWARWCLRVLDQPWPASAALSDRQRAVLTKIDNDLRRG